MHASELSFFRIIALTFFLFDFSSHQHEKKLRSILPFCCLNSYVYMKDCLNFTLGPCGGLLVAVLHMISKYVDLANCTLKIHIYWMTLQSASEKSDSNSIT